MNSLWTPVFIFAGFSVSYASEVLPISVEVVPNADALGKVHLYDLEKEYLSEGEELSATMEFDGQAKLLCLRDPPWVHLKWNPRGLQQVFQVRPDQMVENAESGAMFQIRGHLRRNRPDLDYQEKEKQGVHHFNLKILEMNSIEVKVTEKQCRARFHEILGKNKERLQQICSKHGVSYRVPTAGSGNLSWYRGKIAITDVISPTPIYSRSPVSYASASVLIDPANGAVVGMVIQLRTHQDPPD